MSETATFHEVNVCHYLIHVVFAQAGAPLAAPRAFFAPGDQWRHLHGTMFTGLRWNGSGLRVQSFHHDVRHPAEC